MHSVSDGATAARRRGTLARCGHGPVARSLRHRRARPRRCCPSTSRGCARRRSTRRVMRPRCGRSRRGEFGTGIAAPSEGHIQAANELIVRLRAELIKLNEPMRAAALAATREPNPSNIGQLARPQGSGSPLGARHRTGLELLLRAVRPASVSLRGVAASDATGSRSTPSPRRSEGSRSRGRSRRRLHSHT